MINKNIISIPWTQIELAKKPITIFGVCFTIFIVCNLFDIIPDGYKSGLFFLGLSIVLLGCLIENNMTYKIFYWDTNNKLRKSVVDAKGPQEARESYILDGGCPDRIHCVVHEKAPMEPIL